MARMNDEFAGLVLEKLQKLDPATTPRWGTMNVPQLLGHLRIVLLYTMGHGPEMPFKGNMLSRNVIRHLIVNQLIALPKNVRLPRPKGMKEMPPPPEATLEELREAMQSYNAGYQRGELPPRVHPFFGELSANEWNKLHAAHFRHHLLQFGVW